MEAEDAAGMGMEGIAEDAMEGADAEEIIDEAEMVLNGHNDPVYGVAFHPQELDMVATAGGDDVGGVWSLSTGERTQTLSGHTDTVNLVAWSGDGSYLATGSLDGTVRVWEVAKGFALVNHLQGPGEDILWMQWHPKGNILLAGSQDCTAWMWSVPKGKEMQCFAGHSGPVLCGGFTPDGKHVVTGSEDGTMKVWSPKTGSAKNTFRDQPAGKEGGMEFHQEPVLCLDIHPDNKQCVTGGADGQVILSNIVTGQVVHRYEGHEDGIEAVAFCPSMAVVASGSLDGTVRVWDMTTNSQRAVCGHKSGVTILKWHPSLPVFFSASLDRTVQVNDARDGVVLHRLTGHTDTVLDVALSPKCDVLLSGGDDNTARLFRLPALPAAAPPAGDLD